MRRPPVAPGRADEDALEVLAQAVEDLTRILGQGAVGLGHQGVAPVGRLLPRRLVLQLGGRSATSTVCPGAITVSQWQRFSSWRTLPGNPGSAGT
jgi:hypothetical protein